MIFLPMNDLKIIAVIPARYASTRFPAKLLQTIGKDTVITTTYKAAVQTQLFSEVWVVTDSQLIYNEIKEQGGNVKMSEKNHESGSDRIAEAILDMDVDIVINIQGDEPFIDRVSLEKMILAFKADVQKEISVCSLMKPIETTEDIENPNHVKVVVDTNDYALYFSRAAIPFNRDKSSGAKYWQHIGVYGFRKSELLDFAKLPMKMLENTEKLEQLRYLEYGKRIKMIATNHTGIGIDTPEDLEKAKLLWQSLNN